jgi:hypothetical protein
VAGFDACAWNTTTYRAWCPGSSLWDIPRSDPATKCRSFLSQGYAIVDGAQVRASSSQDKDGFYNFKKDNLEGGNVDQAGGGGYGLKPGKSTCPKDGSQVTRMFGTDYYYALYNPNSQLHTLVVGTDATVNPADSGRLWHDNEPNGTFSHGTFFSALGNDQTGLQNTAWFLGGLTEKIAFSGPHVTDTTFAYSSGDSFPDNDITQSSSSTGSSKTTSFSVGVFGDSGTLNGGESATTSNTTSVVVPSWRVSPQAGEHEVTYEWQSNDPISYSTVTAGDGGPWGLNTLNRKSFGPNSLTVWAGDPTWGPVSVDITRTQHMVEHYQRWKWNPQSYRGYVSGHPSVEDHFAVTDVPWNDTPDGATPAQGKTLGPGINMCDSAVLAPQFKTQCAALDPTPSGNANVIVTRGVRAPTRVRR